MKGVYILLLRLNKSFRARIGSLGNIEFSIGHYAYVGSAQNNLEKRIERHLTKNKKKFWHIDYLLSKRFVNILKVFYKKSSRKEECKIAKRLNNIAKPIKNFGCSDCNCTSHLFKIENMKIFEKTIKNINMKSYLSI